MIRNYLLSLYRNISRNKFYSVLNIVGLSIGLAAAILILLYVQDELSYDKYHEQHENIYRIESHFSIGDKDDKFAIVPIPMGPALKLEFPEVKEFVRFMDAGSNTLFKYEDKEYYEDRFTFTDSTVFDVYSNFSFIGNYLNDRPGLYNFNLIGFDKFSVMFGGYHRIFFTC